MSLPTGVKTVTLDGEERLATEGEAVYGEPTVDGWRVWGGGRSKLAAMLEKDLSIDFGPETNVLYLGAGAGTTVSHLADVCNRVYAIEFAPRPGKRLLSVARDREAVIPLLKDARRPESYAHVVESGCDLLVQDVATPGQAQIASSHEAFLHEGATVAVSIKAASEDVTADPSSVFEEALSDLDDTYTLDEHVRLEPYHEDHLAVVGHLE